jgi:hypothetical protein
MLMRALHALDKAPDAGLPELLIAPEVLLAADTGLLRFPVDVR